MKYVIGWLEHARNTQRRRVCLLAAKPMGVSERSKR